jgi:hypothetical protein
VSARLQSAIAAHAPKSAISYWAGILLDGRPTQFWTEIWPLLTEGARLELVTSIASFGNSTVFKEITDDAVIQIYFLLEREYPYSTDPQHGSGAYAVGGRDQIADFRNGAFNIMKSRGLVRGIEKAMEEFGYPWLRAQRIEALKVRRQLKWSPWPPSRLFALISERQTNLLENPYVQLAVAILVNLAANLLFPDHMSRTERAFYTAFVMVAILFGLNSQKLRQKNRLSFGLLFVVVLIYLILELAYFAYFRRQ